MSLRLLAVTSATMVVIAVAVAVLVVIGLASVLRGAQRHGRPPKDES